MTAEILINVSPREVRAALVEEGVLQLTPRRHSFSLRGGGQQLGGLFEAFRATLSVRRYEHDELEGEEIGTAFKNDTTEVEVMGTHRAAGRIKGSLGGWVLDRAFSAEGAEALSKVTSDREALMLGIRCERGSHRFFKKYGERFEDSEGKQIFLEFAEEEREHLELLIREYRDLVRRQPKPRSTPVRGAAPGGPAAKPGATRP